MENPYWSSFANEPFFPSDDLSHVPMLAPRHSAMFEQVPYIGYLPPFQQARSPADDGTVTVPSSPADSLASSVCEESPHKSALESKLVDTPMMGIAHRAGAPRNELLGVPASQLLGPYPDSNIRPRLLLWVTRPKSECPLDEVRVQLSVTAGDVEQRMCRQLVGSVAEFLSFFNEHPNEQLRRWATESNSKELTKKNKEYPFVLALRQTESDWKKVLHLDDPRFNSSPSDLASVLGYLSKYGTWTITTGGDDRGPPPLYDEARHTALITLKRVNPEDASFGEYKEFSVRARQKKDTSDFYAMPVTLWFAANRHGNRSPKYAVHFNVVENAEVTLEEEYMCRTLAALEKQVRRKKSSHSGRSRGRVIKEKKSNNESPSQKRKKLISPSSSLAAPDSPASSVLSASTILSPVSPPPPQQPPALLQQQPAPPLMAAHRPASAVRPLSQPVTAPLPIAPPLPISVVVEPIVRLDRQHTGPVRPGFYGDVLFTFRVTQGALQEQTVFLSIPHAASAHVLGSASVATNQREFQIIVPRGCLALPFPSDLYELSSEPTDIKLQLKVQLDFFKGSERRRAIDEADFYFRPAASLSNNPFEEDNGGRDNGRFGSAPDHFDGMMGNGGSTSMGGGIGNLPGAFDGFGDSFSYFRQLLLDRGFHQDLLSLTRDMQRSPEVNAIAERAGSNAAAQQLPQLRTRLAQLRAVVSLVKSKLSPQLIPAKHKTDLATLTHLLFLEPLDVDDFVVVTSSTSGRPVSTTTTTATTTIISTNTPPATSTATNVTRRPPVSTRTATQRPTTTTNATATPTGLTEVIITSTPTPTGLTPNPDHAVDRAVDQLAALTLANEVTPGGPATVTPTPTGFGYTPGGRICNPSRDFRDDEPIIAERRERRPIMERGRAAGRALVSGRACKGCTVS